MLFLPFSLFFFVMKSKLQICEFSTSSMTSDITTGKNFSGRVNFYRRVSEISRIDTCTCTTLVENVTSATSEPTG